MHEEINLKYEGEENGMEEEKRKVMNMKKRIERL